MYNDMNKSEKNDIKNENTKGLPEDKFNVSAFGVRHGQCILLFFTLTIAYSMRACMGVALVAMVEDITQHDEIKPNVTDFNLNYTLDNKTEDLVNLTKVYRTVNEMIMNISETENERDLVLHGFLNTQLFTPPFPKFRWTKKVQDTLISSFFWGYMTLQIPAGQLAHRFGARYLLVGALAANCLISFLFPVAAYYGGWVCASICRLFQGLTQACIVPTFHTVLGKWSPLEERGRMSGIIYGGQALGTVLGLPITGFVASSSLGWPGIFRFYGILSGSIAIALWFLLADSPAQHKRISAAERRYIEEALGQTGPKRRLPVPWKQILYNRGLIAIVVAHIGNAWGQLVLYSEVPAYMAHVMGVNLKANGLLTALPFFCMWLMNFFFSWLSDMIVVKKYLNVSQTRKLLNTVGSIPAGIALIALGFSPKNIYIVESILIIICTFKVATHFGFYVNHVDIAPNYAGTMMSISNFCSNLISSQAPMIAGAILTDVSDAAQWRIVFSMTGGLYFLTNLVYVLLGTSELAEWNNPPEYEQVALADCEDLEKNKKEDDLFIYLFICMEQQTVIHYMLNNRL